MALRAKGISGRVAIDQMFHGDVVVYGEKVLERVEEKESRGEGEEGETEGHGF
jgi:hypothetical protein